MTTPDSTAKSNSERLKEEGNAFHMKGKYKAAYQKYSEAIKEDPKNPILWSNRAATCLAMKRYMDAGGDATEATGLDPKYSKAWGRLGTARHNMNAWVPSIDAWKSALGSLPTDRPLTDQEKTFKTHFEDGLKKAQSALAASRAKKVGTAHQIEDMPWSKAFAMEAKLRANGQPSSASGFVIMDASNQWDEGVATLKGQQIRTINGQKCAMGQTGGLVSLSNAILSDPRIFHIAMADFFERYNQQVVIESTQYKAWTTEGPKLIKQQALKRLKQLGWDNVRPALATTIRAWILRAFIQLKVQKVFGDWLEMAIEVLEWGRNVWKDVPRDDRGTIFDDSFLLGVRRLFIIGLVESLGFVGQADTVPEERLQKIKDVANTILSEIEKSKPSTYTFGPGGTVEFGFWASFWLYPRAEALAALGWREMRIANRKRLPAETRQEHYAEAATFYRDAAESVPKDDELHLTYRFATLECLWFSKAPLRITLPYAQDISPLIPPVRKIWGASQPFLQIVDRVEEVNEFAEQAQNLKSLDRGDATLDKALFPDYVTEAYSAGK